MAVRLIPLAHGIPKIQQKKIRPRIKSASGCCGRKLASAYALVPKK